MVSGATMAWFTDSDDSGIANFTSGTLKIDVGTSMIYGVEAGTGDIYEIDLSNGQDYLLFDQTIGTSSDKYVNSLAFDRINHRLYYTPMTAKLYFYDFNQEYYAGSLASTRTAGATFGRGYYWYVPQGSDDLRRVNFNPDGTIAEDVLYFPSFSSGNFSFGDIAMDVQNNILYGSATTGDKKFFKIDLITKVYTQLSVGYPNHMQISFGADGKLYGHVTEDSGSLGTPKGWYTIDLQTGSATELNWSPGQRNYNDLASNFQNKWNPSDCDVLRYYVENTGSKSMHFRVLLNGEWNVQSLSSSNVSININSAMDLTKWTQIGSTFYYLPIVSPGETVELTLDICLDGTSTSNEYQGLSYSVLPTFEAIQSSNFAPYFEWGIDFYGTP